MMALRTYSIKRGHKPNISLLLQKYFTVDVSETDIEKGCEFTVGGIGTIFMQKSGHNVSIETLESSPIASIDVISRWNAFLYDLTGRTTKERKKQLTSTKK
jgi:hypothetical protein